MWDIWMYYRDLIQSLQSLKPDPLPTSGPAPSFMPKAVATMPPDLVPFEQGALPAQEPPLSPGLQFPPVPLS